MKLSARQIALFGQVTIELKPLHRITLFELYQNGWWVTERFGTLFTLVKPRQKLKDGFCCVVKRFFTNINIDSLDEEINRIADAQYEKYKHLLLEKRTYKRIKVKLDDEDNLPTLPPRNRNRNILFPTQKQIVKKI